MPADAPLEQRLITHADMRRMPDGATVYNDIRERWVKHGPWWHLTDGDTRLLGTELKRLSAWLYVLEPFTPPDTSGSTDPTQGRNTHHDHTH